MQSKGRRRIVAAVGLVAIGGIAAVAVPALEPPPRPLIGMVRSTEIKIQPEVSGRIAAIPVKAGDHVRAGDVVAELSNPELAAAVIEAHAAVGEAEAARDRVYAGVRQERVDSASREVDKATADLTLAEQSYARTSALAALSNASKQDRDKSFAALSAAQANLERARSEYAEARRGPTAEDRGTADATVAAARAALAVLDQRLDKLRLKSPVDGVVQVVVGELGEATIPERTVLTVTAAGGQWFQFNIREDQLGGLDIGQSVTLIEGRGGTTIKATISEMRQLGDFSTWRAARAVGDHDLNTFAVRADPAGSPENLEPGMTVWLGAAR